MIRLNLNGAANAKWLALALSAVVVAIGLFAGYRYLAEDHEPAQAAVQRTAAVARGDLTVTISGTGSIEPVSIKTVNAGTSGTISKVLVETGDTVAEGDVLAVFESSDNTRQIRIKELEIQRSRLDLEQLYEQYKMADDEARKSIQLNIEKQRLSIQSAEEELAELKDKEQTGRIIAPISGKVTALNVNAGDSVNANTAAAEITDYSNLQITVPIDELDITEVEVGQTATILVEAFPEETFTGKVTKIADQGIYNNGVATFDVTVKIDEPGAIKAGMSAEASIQVASRENVLLLPVDAVQSAGGRYFVIKADRTDASPSQTGPAQIQRPADRQPGSSEAGNTADRRENSGPPSRQGQQGRTDPPSSGRVMIETGISNEDYIEIVSGLNEGDTVILPTVLSPASNAQTGFPGGGFIGGGFPGGGAPGGGFPGGGAPGGGFPGGARSGFSGGGR